MRWSSFFHIWTPLVFSPKVMPDPTAAERLNEKCEQAMAKMKLQSRQRTGAASRSSS